MSASAERPERIALEGGEALDADVTLPSGAGALIVFAHGSGSGRRSPRNREVAAFLQERGMGTVLVDLLTAGEARVDERTRELRFDIGLLGARVCAVVEWLQDDLPVGVFGASTGAAAALIAAARYPERVGAVVSRGGRPDLAGTELAGVHAPTLLLVGGEDHQVLALNREAQQQLAGPSHLEVIPRAGHLFEEPGAMNQVSEHTATWFARHL